MVPAKFRRSVFLDRDGVLNATIVRNGKDSSPRSFSELQIFDYVKSSLNKLRRKEYLLIVVTNQPDVARGLMTESALKRINDYMKDELNLDDLFACMHDSHQKCYCRKPQPGMLLEAAEKHQISLENSFMIGDRLTDVQAGLNAGCTSFLISENERELAIDGQAVGIHKNLKEVVDYICE